MEVINPHGFVYITINTINGKKYIGQKKFEGDWKNYLGSGVAIKNAIKKYGKENFYKDIVAIAYSKDELNLLEFEFIKNHNAIENRSYYNLCCGGGTTTGLKMTKDQREKISKATSGENNPRYGKQLTVETRKKISDTEKGKIISEEHRKKISDSIKGENHPLYGKHHSDESKDKMSKVKKGKKMSDEAKKNMSIARTGTRMGKDNPMARKIICINTKEIFSTIREAGKKYGLNASNISDCCRGNSKYCGKLSDGTTLVWMYYDVYLEKGEI